MLNTHNCSFDVLVRRIAKMTAEEKVAFATRTLRLVESSGFKSLSAESKARCWAVLDLCTQ